MCKNDISYFLIGEYPTGHVRSGLSVTKRLCEKMTTPVQRFTADLKTRVSTANDLGLGYLSNHPNHPHGLSDGRIAAEFRKIHALSALSDSIPVLLRCRCLPQGSADLLQAKFNDLRESDTLASAHIH